MYKSSYWIKLYHEILVDPRMGTLDDRTWRRTIELFLIAGDCAQAGLLPPIGAIAWTLHSTPDEIQAVLLALEEIGIASHDDSGSWRITNFAKRQAAVSGAGRPRAFRHRRDACDDDRDVERDDYETIRRASITDQRDESAVDTDSDTDIDSDPEEVCDSQHTMAFEDFSPGQTYFARQYKIQPTPSQLLSLAQLERIHGYYRLTQVIDWAIKSGIPPGRAPRAIQTAIAGWCDLPPPGRTNLDRTLDGIEELRRELCGGLDT
jgi:hypothetical protein